jgi:hypothetical protein
MKEGHLIRGTGDRLTRLEISFIKAYKVSIKDAHAILRDIFFYCDFLKGGSLRHKQYNRVSKIILMEYGVKLAPRAVRRWNDRMKLHD